MSPHYVSNQKTEERSVDCIQEIISSDVWAFSIRVEYAFEVERESEILAPVVNEGSRVAAFEVGWLIELFGSADEITTFLLENELLNGFADFLILHEY
jgi:hypothetical protein